jgi:predicted PurR-regulated permease PerM
MNTPQHTRNSWQARWFHFVLWLAIITGFIVFLRAVQPILLPFVLGMFIAYLMDPLAQRLQRMGLGRNAATAVIMLGLFALIFALVAWLAPMVYQQFANLATRTPAMLQEVATNVRTGAAPLLEKLNAISGNGKDAIPTDTTVLVQRGIAGLSGIARGLFSSGAALVNVFALLLIAPIVCFYLIRDWPTMVKKIDGMLPLAYAPTIRHQLVLINRTLASYLRGQLTVMFILSVYYVILFGALGLNFGLVLGILAGCIVIIPYIGSLISVGLGLTVAYGQYDITTNFWMVIAIYAVGQIIETQILTPKIIGDRVGLHPLWMLFGMLAGAVLLGFVGVLLAVPLTAVIGVLVKFAVARYLESGLYRDQ